MGNPVYIFMSGALAGTPGIVVGVGFDIDDCALEKPCVLFEPDSTVSTLLFLLCCDTSGCTCAANGSSDD